MYPMDARTNTDRDRLQGLPVHAAGGRRTGRTLCGVHVVDLEKQTYSLLASLILRNREQILKNIV